MLSPHDAKRKTDMLRRQQIDQRGIRSGGAQIVHINEIVPQDSNVQYPYAKGLPSSTIGTTELRLAGSGGIYYRPTHGAKMIGVRTGDNLWAVGQVAKDGQDMFEWMNDGDLLIAPEGNIYFMPGGEILGLMEDYFPITGGESYRDGYSEDALANSKITITSDALTDDAYLFNIIIGEVTFEAGDKWSAWINSGDDDELQVVKDSCLKNVPENIRFQKPIYLFAGKKVRVELTPKTAAGKLIMVDLDFVR